MNGRTDKALDMMSMARRAGELIIGQDKIFDAIKSGGRLAVFVTEDCSQNVMRTLNAAEARGSIKILNIKDTDRALLGQRLGISAAQAAALPEESGFAKKICFLIEDRSDADE
ncbi:MAG: hypothetical protein RRY12_07330 [Cloacibacillus sp.]